MENLTLNKDTNANQNTDISLSLKKILKQKTPSSHNSVDIKHPIKRNLIFSPDAKFLDSDTPENNIAFPTYLAILAKAKNMDGELHVHIKELEGVQAKFVPWQRGFVGGDIYVRPLDTKDIEHHSKEYNERLIDFAHELQHGIDHTESDLNLVLDLSTKPGGYNLTGKELKEEIDSVCTKKILSEFRAFAIQTAVTKEIEPSKVYTVKREMAEEFNSQSFTNPPISNSSKLSYFEIIKAYIKRYQYNNKSEVENPEVRRFINENKKDLNYAIQLHNRFLPEDKKVK